MTTKMMIGESMSGDLLSLQRWDNGLMGRPYYCAVIDHPPSGDRYLVIRFQGEEGLCCAFDMRALPMEIKPLTGYQFVEGLDREIAKIDPAFLSP